MAKFLSFDVPSKKTAKKALKKVGAKKLQKSAGAFFRKAKPTAGRKAPARSSAKRSGGPAKSARLLRKRS